MSGSGSSGAGQRTWRGGMVMVTGAWAALCLHGDLPGPVIPKAVAFTLTRKTSRMAGMEVGDFRVGRSGGMMAPASFLPKPTCSGRTARSGGVALLLSSPRLQDGTGEWDNDDFLENLSQSGAGPGADEIGDGIPVASDDPVVPGPIYKGGHEEGGGSERFRQLKEAAERAQRGEAPLRPAVPTGSTAAVPPPPHQPQVDTYAQPQPPPYAQPQPPPQSQQQYQPPPPPPPGYYWDPHAQQWKYDPNLVPPPPPSPAGPGGSYAPPQAQASQGEGSGEEGIPNFPRRRRKEFDSISNTSDLYLEQLKIDSSIRQSARQQGDDERANASMDDPRVSKVRAELEPALSKLGKLDSAARTAAEEGMMPVLSLPTRSKDADVDKTTTGMSYKERLMEKAQERKKPTQTPTQTQHTASIAPTEPTAPTPPAAPLPPPPQTQSVAKPEQPQQSTEPVPPADALASPAADVAAMASSIEAPPTPKVSDDVGEEELTARRQIRTLMGLILKHRGGEGFGSGRLRNPMEKTRFADTLDSVIDLLKRETGISDAQLSLAQAERAPETQMASTSSLDGALACASAAIRAYQQDGSGELLVPLTDALELAVRSCNQAMMAGKGDAALENDSPKPYYASEAAADATTKETIVPDATPSAHPSTDNGLALEKTYRALQMAKGDGKYGIKSDLTSEEAGDIINNLVDMRRILLDELETSASFSSGPKSKGTDLTPPETKSIEGQGSSNYQQMLERAKAAKVAKKG